jgi:hypothetical protein
MAELNEKELAEMVADTVLDKFEYKGKTIRKWVQDITEADYVGNWIPVSERLPEVMDGSNGECSVDVLICVADDEQITISTGFYGYYPKSISDQGWWSMWAYGCHQLDSKYKVIAWMPLPEPYRAESEETDADSN